MFSVNNPADSPLLISDQVLSAWLGLGVEVTNPEITDPEEASEQLAKNIDDSPPGFVHPTPAPQDGALVVLDVRWSATDPTEGYDTYRQGHIPGAVYVSMSGQLAGHGAPSAGRHPLPDPTKLTDSLRMLGINNGDTVVVYDNVSSASAARAWWLLRHAGLETVYVLDGGLEAWREAGRPLQAGDVLPVPGDAHLSWGKMPVIDTEDIESFVASGVLIDARVPQRYTGEEEPHDPVAGHIPGAINIPLSEVTDDEGKFLPAGALREYFASRGIGNNSTVAAYCGSGVTASTLILSLKLAGIDAALYPGSFSAWVNNPDAPIATGTEPGIFPSAQ